VQVETNDYVELKSEILDGMRSYMEEVAEDGSDAGYTAQDIDDCEGIIDRFLAAIAHAAGDNARASGAVKDAVLALNALNARCGHSLIETDQREGLCELIIRVAATAGVGSGQDDITEEWREW